MDAQEFITRVVAPGAYYAFAYKLPEAKELDRHKFFRQDKLADAIAWIRANAGTFDIYHAVASYKTGGRRTQANVEAVRCFFYDADIHRDGDGKAEDAVWKNLTELVLWLAEVKDRLPTPNLWISSGYGVHLYWVLDEAIPGEEWTAHAKVFRDLLKSLGARGDIGISADRARVLRPLETFNYKVPDSPAPVKELTPNRERYNLPDYFVTKDFLARLTPGVIPLGPRPNRPVNTGSLAAAKANLSRPPPADFALIATRCLQVKKSLEEEGEHDRYLLWRQMLNLAYFCDNRDAAHDLGRKGINYSEADTDAKFDKTQDERGGKDFGAPTCASLDVRRPGVCEHCEFYGKLNSPYSLGTTADPVDPVELPIIGSVSNPQLLFTNPGFQFAFDYELAGHVSHIRVDEAKISGTADKVRALFVPMGISLNRANASKFSEFVVAWITRLKEARMWVDAPPSFGWVAHDEGGYQGVAIAGTLYRTDGTEGVAQPGDPTIHKNYQPKGDIKLWRRATEYVIGDRPELHTIVGLSFGAPLMELVGESGILSMWSQLSGARKTSTARVATAVWCDPIVGMSALKDTAHSVTQSLAETKIMPVFWDEIHISNKDQIGQMVDMFFNITQGRGRARLDPKIEQRAVGRWRTLAGLLSNKPNAELIEQDRAHTNAGAVRLFEYEIEPTGGKADPEAMSIVQMAEHNYGLAGRVYIRWVIDNLDVVQKRIKALRVKLHKDIPDIQPEERFHVATILGVVTGAWIANEIGLVSLNVRGVYGFLKAKMLNIRDKRQDDILSETDNFERFVSDTKERITTQSFSKQGRRVGNFNYIVPLNPPLVPFDQAFIHIAIDEQEMRFERNAFKKWCDRNKQSHIALLGWMEKEWGIKKTRAVLAIGTQYTSGAKVEYYRLSLARPELEHHLKTEPPEPASNVVPLHPPAAE